MAWRNALIKSSVSVSSRCPKTFRVERIGYIVSSDVVKEFSKVHTSGKFVEIRVNLAPVNTSWFGAYVSLLQTTMY